LEADNTFVAVIIAFFTRERLFMQIAFSQEAKSRDLKTTLVNNLESNYQFIFGKLVILPM